MLADYPNWAFDHIARSVSRRLKQRFNFRIEYAARHPWIKGSETDLLYIFYWGYRIAEASGVKRSQVVRDVASWAWELSHHGLQFTKEEFAERYLQDCACATTPCAGIFNALRPCYGNLVHCPNGVEHAYFSSGLGGARSAGKLKIGWVGNPEDEHKVKGLHEILIPAAKGYDFSYSHGSMTRRQLRRFYAGIDVLAIASKSESQPLPLLEAMSAGCFPVCTNVGIVPEIIVDTANGRIVQRSVEAFADAFQWCERNVSQLRENRANQSNAVLAQDWDIWAERFGDLFDAVVNQRGGDSFSLPTSLRGVVTRTPHPQDVQIVCGQHIVPRWRRHLNCARTDGADMVRRWFLGDRFQKAPGDAFYRWAVRRIGWWRAVNRRFAVLRDERGVRGALVQIANSLLRHLKT